MKALLCGLSLLALAGCSDGVELSIDLKTDYAPGIEFASIDLVVVSAGDEVRDDVVATSRDDFITGRRIAELGDIEAGMVTARVTLRNTDGDVVAERQTLIDLSVDYGLTVVITRSCEALLCPASSDPRTSRACFGGACVDERCSPERPDLCGSPGCASDAECTTAVGCAIGRCIDTICLFDGQDDRCATGEYCNSGQGCESPPALGDAAVPDTGPSDTGPRDTGGMDAGDAASDAADAGADVIDAGDVGAPDGCIPGIACALGSPCELGVIDCPDATPICVSAGPAEDGTTCRPSMSRCDQPEVCDGVSLTCPPDVVRPMGVPCRSSGAACDAAEFCDGADPACPPDLVEVAGTPCRTSLGSCDIEETCNGVSGTCPADLTAIDLTPCGVCGACIAGACSETLTPMACLMSQECCPMLPAGSVCIPTGGLCPPL
jgi:hypothetical protein